MNNSIRLQSDLLTLMLEEARKQAPLECCGLLAGPPLVADAPPLITAIFPAPNALASPTAYEIAPAGLFRLFREIRATNLVHLGIYHSHPTTEAFPSPTDIASAFYPDVAYFIVSLFPSASPALRAFSIRSGVVTELIIQFE